MRNIIQNFKKTADYQVLVEVFKLKRLALSALFNVLAFVSMYATLELFLIYKYGF